MSNYAEDADAAEPSDDAAADGDDGTNAPDIDESEMPHPPPTATEEPDTKPIAATDRDGTPDSPGVG